MNGKYLLDPNIVIALFAKDENVAQKIADSSASVPVIVIAELLSGARKSGRVEANVERAEEFAGANVILNCDLELQNNSPASKTTCDAQANRFPKTTSGSPRLRCNTA